ncbi:MAG: Tfp pilus assembly protein PilV [Gammaproteobacteria bacterium]|jgi:Tfp pilus assembly protein PilV
MSLAQRGSGLLDCLIALTVMSIGSLGMAEMGVHRQQLLLAANQHAETVEAAWNTAVLLGSTGGLASETIAPADARFNIALYSDNGGSSILVRRVLQNNRTISVSMPVQISKRLSP